MPFSRGINLLIASLEAHPERVFVAKSLTLVVLLAIVDPLLSPSIIILFLFLAPIFVLSITRLISIHYDKSLGQVLRESLTFLPIPHLERDNYKSQWAIVTLGLILINVAIFYLFKPPIFDIDLGHYVFVPEKPQFWNVLLSQITSVFLHVDSSHLWGNMLFLWAFGTVIERRIGPSTFLVLYLILGVLANLVEALLMVLLVGELPSGIGASGAISGVMGLYAVRCYFKTMVFPIPLLGAFAYILPISFKIRINSLVLIGLYFWTALSGGINQFQGSESDVAYWCHVGGMIVGIILAFRFNFGHEALTEKHLDTAKQAFSHKGFLGTDKGEESIRAYLRENPNDPEAMVLLAAHLTRFEKNDEGHLLYQQAVELMLSHRQERALEVFKEYFNRYFVPIRTDLQYRLAFLAERVGDPHLASRSLEALLPLPDLPVDIRKSVLFHCQRLCRLMGLNEAADHYFEEHGKTLMEH